MHLGILVVFYEGSLGVFLQVVFSTRCHHCKSSWNIQRLQSDRSKQRVMSSAGCFKCCACPELPLGDTSNIHYKRSEMPVTFLWCKRCHFAKKLISQDVSHDSVDTAIWYIFYFIFTFFPPKPHRMIQMWSTLFSEKQIMTQSEVKILILGSFFLRSKLGGAKASTKKQKPTERW